MVRNPIKLKKRDRKTLEDFYANLKTALVKAHGYQESEADFEAYKWLLKNTNKPPKDYFKIFYCMPEEARKKVVKHMGYKTVTDFKKSFSKQLNVYRQSSFRRDQENEGEQNGTEN